MKLGQEFPLPFVGMGGGGGFSAEATALFAAMSTPPSAARKVIINRLIASLKSGGVWPLLGGLQVNAAADAQAASLNWINPAGGPTATLVSAPTFTADKGWLPNGTSSYVNTQMIPSTQATLTANAAMIGVWSNTGAKNGSMSRGVWGPGPTPRTSASLALFGTAPFAATIQAALASNYATSVWTTAINTRVGATTVAVQREDANTLTVYSGGVLRATNLANASVGSLPSKAFFLGALNNDGSPANFEAWSHAAFFWGNPLTPTQHATLAAALDTYMSDIGNVVTSVVGWGDSLSNTTWYNGAASQSDNTGRAFRISVSQGNSGETTAQITTRMLADVTYNNLIQSIWAGRNDINNPAQTVDVTAIKAGVASMVAAAQARSNKWLVIGVTNANINGPAGGFQATNAESVGTAIHTAVTGLNNDLSALYAPNFLDIRSLLVARGLLGDVNDIADNALDVPPRSYMADDVHYNSSIGCLYIGQQIELKLEALGY